MRKLQAKYHKMKCVLMYCTRTRRAKQQNSFKFHNIMPKFHFIEKGRLNFHTMNKLYPLKFDPEYPAKLNSLPGHH